MYIVTVESKIPEFIAYLEEEATCEQPCTFQFPDKETASKIIARFMLYFLREAITDDAILHKKIRAEDKEDFLLHISSDAIVQILHSIQQQVALFLRNGNPLHFEGFTNFRLKEEKKALITAVSEALETFRQPESPTENLDVLASILREQPTIEEEVHIIVEANNRLVLRSPERVLLSEHVRNEDTVLSHLIVLGPKLVKVHETHGTITKETAYILRYLFKSKVAFTREKYNEHRHSKE